MARTVFQRHWLDGSGCPEGGVAFGSGFTIAWQRGPLGRGPERLEQNGAFLEDVLDVCLGRLTFLQGSKFRCDENSTAAIAIATALQALSARTSRREEAKTEGTLLGN